MSEGVIKVAKHEGTFIIKMEGDVRLTLCLSFDRFIETMFAEQDFHSVLFDLTAAVGIDSTTLGLMAKIAIKAQESELSLPVVVANNASIIRLLESMGFDDIFELATEQQVTDYGLEHKGVPLPAADVSAESDVKQQVIAAHKVLMSINAQNHSTFKELVETLESQG